LIYLAGVAGLEPATPGFGERASEAKIKALLMRVLSNRITSIKGLVAVRQTIEPIKNLTASRNPEAIPLTKCEAPPRQTAGPIANLSPVGLSNVDTLAFPLLQDSPSVVNV
jgi:hypothetical protein